MQFLEKVSSLVNFQYSYPKAWFFSIICQSFLKDSFKKKVSKSFKQSSTSNKKIRNPLQKQQKHGGKSSPVSSFATKYCINYISLLTYHLNVEGGNHFLQLGEADATG